MVPFSRRDFLKLLSIAPMSMMVQPLLKESNLSSDPAQKNIILIVLDTWSADNVSLYGYPRETTPNLEKFAENAIVYHRHYAPATFTVPGTASILTGLYPWTHRALALEGGQIIDKYRGEQIFHLLSPTHSTLGYAQNNNADLLLYQAGRDLMAHIPLDAFSLEKDEIYSMPFFQNDPLPAFASFEDDIFQRGVGFDGSLYLGPFRRIMKWRKRDALNNEFKLTYPRGLPDATELFKLEDLVDGAIKILGGLSQPSFTYLHFFPPHGPYRPKGKFNKAFDDKWHAKKKRVHPLAIGGVSFQDEENQRKKYDQYIASWDTEIARLLEFMKNTGLLDTSVVIITSDHGELFERGEVGHSGYMIYDAIVHVPLIISRPGQKQRIDIHTSTSNVDLYPTIANLSGKTIPSWCEGQLLPEFGGTQDANRSIFSMDAKTNSAFAPLTKVSFSLLKGNYRLTYYQYAEFKYKAFELYDLEKDPNEMINLFPAKPSIAIQLQDELLQKLADVNRPYEA